MAKKASKEPTIEPVPYVLSVAAAAKELSVHRNTVYELIRERQLPAFKIGRRTLIRRDLLYAFIDKLAEDNAFIGENEK